MTIQANTESGEYRNCPTKVVVFDSLKEADKYVVTGELVHSYQDFCISKPSLFRFSYQKMAYFTYVLVTSERVQLSLTADLLQYKVLGGCLMSNATNQCSIHQRRFANEAVVCITATTRESDSDIEYGITKATVSLWKKIIHFFIFTTIIVLFSIPYGFILYVLCVPLGLVKYKICHIFNYIIIFLSLVITAYGLYIDIDFFVKIIAL